MKGLIFFSFLMALIFSSCQKELDIDLGNDPPPPPPPGTTNDSIYLSKYIELDTTLPSGQDTLLIANFFYDNSKRITHYTVFGYFTSVDEFSEIKYHYNGNDTIPYKMTQLSSENGGPFGSADTIFYTYINGKVLKDSMRSYIMNPLQLFDMSFTRYTVNGNNVLVQNTFINNFASGTPDTFHYVGTASLVFSGDNIIEQTSPSGVTGAEYFQMTYDNHIDPFYRIDVHYPVSGTVDNLSIEATKNNILSQNVGTTPGNLLAQYRNTYVYRQDGYPLITRGIDLSDPTYHIKALYFYTK